jgi:cytochrome P450
MSGAWFQDPYATYSALRVSSPVANLEALNSFMLTSHDAVYTALRDHQRFSSGALSGAGPDAGPGNVILISDDPPRHTRLRGTVNRAFTPKRIKDVEARIHEVVDEYLAAFDDGEVEFMDGLAVPLPITVIAELMGIPAKDRADFKRWSDWLIISDMNEEQVPERNAQMQAMEDYFRAIIAERRTAPMDDLMTALTVAEIDGQRLAEWEILGMANLLLIAGNETTTNLLGNMLAVLAERPELWQQLRGDRSLIEGVIEETLRYDSPVQMLPRLATGDTELCGVPIPQGAQLMIAFGAANRDPVAFPEPDEFRLDRDLKNHVAFGMGIHYCLGAPLARTEARIALNALLDRYETVERGEGDAPHQHSSLIVRGFERLPLRFA